MKTTGRNSPTSMQPLTVAGIMSGTSADGIDVAIVRITPPERGDVESVPTVRLLVHVAVPYPANIRRRVLSAMNGECESVAELSQLHWRLGQLYADAVESALKLHPVSVDLVGCHGQTVYHQAAAKRVLGGKVACTWQLGEASVIAARLGMPVVSDFRSADIAAGGQGAPLVPLLDYVAFRDSKRNRVLQNLGGIGNLTVVPANAKSDDVLAFDTGPANMVIDALMAKCFQKQFDRGGETASRGHVQNSVLTEFLSHRFFRLSPPKSAGREEFGREFAARFLMRCRKASRRDEDAVATATALTARSIGMAWKTFVQPALVNAPTDCIVSGGGAKNRTLMKLIGEELSVLKIADLQSSDSHGMPIAAKEAVAFSLLAYETWHRRPGNLPRATGAQRAVVLGKITYA